MATEMNVSKSGEPVHSHTSNGTMILVIGLAAIMVIALIVVAVTFSTAPATGALPAENRSLEAASAREQGLANASAPLALEPVAAYAARYAGMAEAYVSKQPVTAQSLNASSERYAGMARAAMPTTLSLRAIDAWAARYQASYARSAVQASSAVARLSTSAEPVSQGSLNAWAGRYTGMADNYVAQPLSRQAVEAWSARYTGLAGTGASQSALGAWAARYEALADSMLVRPPASQKALAAWSGRYAGMAQSFLASK